MFEGKNTLFSAEAGKTRLAERHESSPQTRGRFYSLYDVPEATMGPRIIYQKDLLNDLARVHPEWMMDRAYLPPAFQGIAE